MEQTRTATSNTEVRNFIQRYNNKEALLSCVNTGTKSYGILDHLIAQGSFNQVNAMELGISNIRASVSYLNQKLDLSPLLITIIPDRSTKEAGLYILAKKGK